MKCANCGHYRDEHNAEGICTEIVPGFEDEACTCKEWKPEATDD